MLWGAGNMPEIPEILERFAFPDFFGLRASRWRSSIDYRRYAFLIFCPFGSSDKACPVPTNE